jgi:hypothetical protein
MCAIIAKIQGEREKSRIGWVKGPREQNNSAQLLISLKKDNCRGQNANCRRDFHFAIFNLRSAICNSVGRDYAPQRV